MNKPLRLFASILSMMLFTSFQMLASGFDLAVGISTTNPNPAIYSNVPITVTATNTGTTAGTGIEIRLLQCGGNIGSFVQGTGLVYATTGTANLGTWDYISQQWTIPSLAPGQSATLSFTLFALTNQPRNINVFTQAAATPDVDSSPGNLPIANGNWVCTDNEDDEAVLTLNGISGPQPDMNLSSFLAVQNNGQAGSSVIAAGSQVAAGTTISFVDHLAYLSFPVQVPTFSVVINAYLSTDATLSANDLLLAGDTRTLNSTVQSYGFTEGGFGNGAIPANTSPGSYFIIVKYDASDLIAESNEANNFKILPIVVTGQSGGGNGIDLELSLAQNTASPLIYNNYTTTATLVNKGPQAATGVKVKWEKPAGVVYTGGNEFTASQGSFNPNGDQVWTVGSIPANGTATLKVSYFLLQNGAPVTYAQVIATNETDVDSQPNNGTPPTVNQDDEANTGGGTAPVLKADLVGQGQEVIPGTNNCFTNPGSNFVYYSMMVHNNGTAVAGAFKVKFYFSTDNTLSSNDIFWATRNVPSLGINGSSGYSPAFLSITEAVPASLANGIYYIIMHVDADNEVAESNEGNQYFAQLVNIGAPNVVLSNYSGLPTSYSPGSNFSLNVQMSYAAQNFPSSFLTGNAEVQVTLAQAGQSPITVGSTSFPASEFASGNLGKNVAVNLPTNLQLGNYTLQVRVNTSFCEQLPSDNFLNQNVTLTASGNPCAAITITPSTNILNIAGATAPHVLIKVFNPNWSLNFQCLDNCANPLTLNNLNAGVYHLQIKLLNASWGENCYLERDVTVNSFGAGNGTSIASSDERQRLSLDRFYPSPTSYQVTVDVFSPIAQAATLDFYDQLGRPVHSMKVQLSAGNNPVEVLVFDWKSGAYNVIARGEETGLPAYGRFLKVWEE